MSDPHEGGSGISVTIKADEPGGKYNDPKSPGTWIVFHGSPQRVREQIVEVFEFGGDALERPLYDLVNEATKLFKGVSNVGQALGGTVLSDGAQRTALPVGSSFGGGDRANDDVQPKPAEDDESAPVKAMIEAATSRDALKKIWAENKAVFDANPALMDVWKAKGKSLPA